MKNRINDIVLISISVVLITICSWIEIPFIVPFTLQTLAIFVITGLFKFKISFTSIIIYVLMGLLGIPVFAGFNGGIGALLTYTGGFIIGFIFIPVINIMVKKIFNNYKSQLYISFILSLLIIYIIGSIWFYFVYMHSNQNVTIFECLIISVLPFIIPDLMKIIISIFLIKRLGELIKNEAMLN